MKKLSNDEYKKKLALKNPWVEPLGEYTNAKTPLLFRCNICQREWLANPGKIMAGTKCRPCSIKLNTAKQTKTDELFRKELSEKNHSIIPLEQYVNGKMKISFQCSDCKHIWAAAPQDILSGKGCPKCGIKKNAIARRKTQEFFLAELSEKKPNVELVGIYQGSRKDATFRCKHCGYQWPAKPHHILAGHGCPECGGSKLKTHDRFLVELKSINPYIEIKTSYVNAKTDLLCHCLVCQHEWFAKPLNLLRGTGCPQCEKRNKTSFPEQAIFYYVRALFPDAVNRYKGEFDPSELDIYIPSRKIGIEYDGVYYHKAISKDIKKFMKCQELGVNLIRIIESNTLPEEKTADTIITRSRPYDFDSLNTCIIELLRTLGYSEQIDTYTDSFRIREQYYNLLKENSLYAKYPSIAAEWDQAKNGSITPQMVSYGSHDKYYWICSSCKNGWRAAVCDRTGERKRGCPECGKRTTKNKLLKSNNDFLNELKVSHPNIRPLESYKGYHTKIEFACAKCGETWHTTPAALLRGNYHRLNCNYSRGHRNLSHT